MTLRYGVVLAGGQSRRMGGEDKAALRLAGRPLIAHVIDRLAPQVDRLVIAGRHDYGTGLATVGDDPLMAGPVAALYGVARWLGETHGKSRDKSHGKSHEETHDDVSAFVTAPADGPFVPEDLAERLTEHLAGAQPQSAIALDDAGIHPTFAAWRMADLDRVRGDLGAAPSLRRLAELTDARRIAWPGTHSFFNVNTPDDLAAAEALRAASCANTDAKKTDRDADPSAGTR